jgi:acetoin utilization deacetylase AcuC-like enzyme
MRPDGEVARRDPPVELPAVAILYTAHERFLEHDTGPGHPERPSRMQAVEAGVAAADLREALIPVEPVPAALEAIERVHPGRFVSALDRFCQAGGGYLDADTHVGSHSFEAARLAAGSGLEVAARLAAGEGEVAFCALRPPGHHATATKAMGFCLFNNVAVTAAALAERGERVLIVDYDAHHGNGTQDIFYEDPRVMYVSFHEWPLFPGTGRADETGAGAGLGTTINLPFPHGTTGEHYRRAVDEVLAPAAAGFGPTWLLLSAGFDAHRRDPLAGLALTAGDFADLTRSICALVPAGRRILFLEGGYDLEALSLSVGASLAGLVGGGYRPEAPSSGGPGGEVVDAALKNRVRTSDG